MFRWLCVVFVLCTLVWSNLLTADEVQLRFPVPGKDAKKSDVLKIRGRIEYDKSNVNKVVLAVGKEEEVIEVTNIEGIAYDREPTEFAAIRTAIANGNYNDAAEEAKSLAAAIKAGSSPAINGEWAQKDLEFWLVYLPAMQAIEGSAKVELNETANNLKKFLAANSTHYRFYEGTETLGLLYALAPGDPVALSQPYFTKLATSPELREMQYRGKLLMARTLLKTGNFQRAGQLLTPMIAEKQDSRMMASQIAQAKVAFAQATASSGNADEALKMLQAVIDETPSGDNETHARANIAMGNILLAKQNKMEALFAFLKVDQLFFQYPEQRAEALIRLAKLWHEIPEPRADRANDARDRLQSLYPYTTIK